MDEVNIDNFKPSYVWPNKAFHFRLYYQSDKCRIFLIENIVHNWEWLKENREKIKKTDYFFVQLGWYFGDWLAEESSKAVDLLGLDKSQFRIMFPDFPTKNIFEYYGFQGDIVNHNCFLDENKFRIINSQKIYDAIYVARLAPFKRHFLVSKVSNLALVAGDSWGKTAEGIPQNYIYKNEAPLSSEEVVIKLSQSKVGLLLSEFEGACYSSSEYLLSGLPVVSTWSHGGRSIWYNDYNSITCDANPDSISEAAAKLASSWKKADKIREMHIQLANQLRHNFIKMHQNVLRENNDSVDAEKFFFDNFKHKMLTSDTPNFEEIFS